MDEYLDTEEQARAWVWRLKCGGKDFSCPHCQIESYYIHQSRPEIRTCKGCHRQIRMRVGTLLQDSKLSVLTWVKAIHLVIHSKEAISAAEIKRQLGIKSYGTTWNIVNKIREEFQALP